MRLSRRTTNAKHRAAAASSGNRVPFAASSYYNETFASRYGSNMSVPIHADSDLMVEAMRRQMTFPGPGVTGTIVTGTGTRYFKFRGDPTQYTYPVYIVTSSTPMATVRYSGARAESSESSTTRFTGGGTISVPVDPTWKPATPNLAVDSGADSQIIVWDRDNVLGDPNGPQFWDFWKADQVNTGDANVAGTWATNGSGEYTCVNCSHFTGEATSSGVPSNSPNAYVSRGAGVPYMAGLIFGWEWAAALAADAANDTANNKIKHALAVAYASPDNSFTPPASKSDGTGLDASQAGAGNPYSGPEGAFLKLSEHFDVEGLSTAEKRVVARTLRDYGAVVIDNTGNPKAYFEHVLTGNYTTAPDADAVFGDIPMEALHVVDWTGAGTPGNEVYSAAIPGGIAGTPAILGTVTGTVAGSTGDVVSASQTPSAGELVLAIVTEKGNTNFFTTNTVGNGMTWGWQAGQFRSYCRTAVYTTGQLNNWLEVVAGVVPASPSAGAVTLTTNNAAADAAKALQVLRLTAGSRPIRVVTNRVGATDTSTPSVKLKSPASGSLLLGIVSQRLGTCTGATGWTANQLNTTAGSGGNPATVSTFTLPSTGADVTFAPTLSSATEWCVMIVEVT